MTSELFSYEQYEVTRLELIKTVQQNMSDQDKRFLLSVSNADPDWSIYNFERFPSVQWKLQNLVKLKTDHLDKHKEQHNVLASLLSELG